MINTHLPFTDIYEELLLIYLREKIELVFNGSLPKCPKLVPSWNQESETQSRSAISVAGIQVTKLILLTPRVCTGRKVESRARARNHTQALRCETQGLSTTSLHACSQIILSHIFKCFKLSLLTYLFIDMFPYLALRKIKTKQSQTTNKHSSPNKLMARGREYVIQLDGVQIYTLQK